jgi:hypothetical protein
MAIQFANKYDDERTGMYYENFSDSAWGVELCDDEGCIVEVKIALHPDQSRGHLGMPRADYWGWINLDGKIDLIQPSFGQFEMQFPGGFEIEEKLGRGKAARLSIEEVRVTKKSKKRS